MNLDGVVQTGKNEYAIKTLKDLEILSMFIYPGSKVYCIENKKQYLCTNVNEWVSI